MATNVPQWNYAKEARKGRTPISTKYGRVKTSVVGRHAAARRAEIGRIVDDYQSGRKLPRKYASPTMIQRYGRDARLPVADAIDSDARPLMLPSYGERMQPRSRTKDAAWEIAQRKGVTHLKTPAQIAAARRNLERARASKKGKGR